MIRRISLIMVMFVVGLLVTACAERTALGALQDTPQVVPPLTASDSLVTPSPSLPPTITLTQTPPEPPATPTPSGTPTPGSHEYVVQAGDACWTIAYAYGHQDPAVLAAIDALNGAGTCGSLREGQTVLIPRPTATPTAIGADLTQTAVATAAPPQVTLEFGPSFAIQPYVVQSGDTLSSIAIIHDSSLQQICELNPLPDGIDCGACVWESPNCCCTSSISLSAGQQINVPAPTPTPTLTPTFTGSETPTATPTHRPPQVTYPRDGQAVSGAVRLTWIGAVLADDEHYLVTVRDETTGGVFNATTRQLSLDIPPEYLPNDGQAHTMAWVVSIVRFGADGLFYPVGGFVPEHTFTWTGW